MRLVVKGHKEGFILAVAKNAEEEIVGGVLLEFEPIADAVGSVKQHADAKGEIGLFTEVTNVLRRVVVEDFEVLLFEIGDEFVAAIENGEEDVDEIDRNLNGEARFLRRFLSRGRGRLGILSGRILFRGIRCGLRLLGRNEKARQKENYREQSNRAVAHVG